MNNQNNAAQAAERDPLSDQFVNAVIRQHGYDCPEAVIARLWQWIGLNGSENGVTLLMYEAHKALVKLRAPVADERALDLLDTLFTAYENGTPCYEEPDSQGGYLGMAFRIDDDTFRSCADLLNKHRSRADAALASAPVAGEAQPVAVLRFERGAPGHQNEMPRVVSCNWMPDGDYPVYAAPQASEAVDRSPNVQGSQVDRSADLQGDRDIVQRLRDNAELDASEGGNPQVIALELEAAAEIDRLRAALSAQPGAQSDAN